MDRKYLDLAGLTAYDAKIKGWFKSGVVDIADEAIKILFMEEPKPVVYDPYVTFTAQEDNSSIGLSRLSTNQILVEMACLGTSSKPANQPSPTCCMRHFSSRSTTM